MSEVRGSLLLVIALLLMVPGLPVGLAQAALLEPSVLNVDYSGIEWMVVGGASSYDVLRGDVGTLRQTGGDFGAATRACLADDYGTTRLPYEGVPKPGEAFWFLVRGDSGTQAGTYDSGGSGQVDARDAEIEAAPSACFSPVVSRAPIAINGDTAFTAAKGVVGGSGTAADPYVIAGWDIMCPSMNNTAGIEISNTTVSFVIRNVKVQSCHYGLRLVFLRNGRIERSRATGIVHGISVFSGGDAVVNGNLISFHQGSGISVLSATNVLIMRNTLDSGFVGTNLDRASQCAVHHNNFLSNTVQVIDQRGGVNAWDDGYPEGGNYWTDYQGVDECSGPAQDDCSTPDGFGDTPYVVEGATTDRYPRMIPVSAEGDTVPPTVAIASPGEGAVFTTVPIMASGTAADVGSGVRRVELRVNGGLWVIAGGTSPWGLSIDLAPGPNVIEARSFDHAGNISTIDSIAVTYDAPIWESVLQTDKATYGPGEIVEITLMLTNRSTFPVTLHFSSTCQAFFSVADAVGAPVYDYRLHIGCLFLSTERTWQPDETASYVFIWNQVDDAGQQVPAPAEYQIRGFLDSFEEVPDALATVSVAP